MLLGASGSVGQLIAQELQARGHTIVAAARDPRRAGEVLDAVAVTAAELATVDTADARSLDAVLAEAEVCVDATGTAGVTGNAPLEAAVRRGVHHVDVTWAPAVVHDAYERLDGPAREAGITAVPAAGFAAVPGDLLADVVTDAVTRPREVHIAYALPDRRYRRIASAGVRRDHAGLLGRPMLAFEDGALVEEPLAEARRLAWFPRPLGPHHAAGVPAVEPLAVPRHAPTVRLVRTYLALSSWQAELLQLTGNAARWQPARRRLAARAERGRPGVPGPALRSAARWACVVETAGEEGIARAWMNGRDPYAFTAMSVVLLAERAVAGRAAAGVVPPALVDVAGELLDDLAGRSDVRWAISRPDA